MIQAELALPSPEITDLKLAASALLVLLAGAISSLAGLGLLKSLLVGVLRTVIQLALMGYALGLIFGLQSPLLVAGVLMLMLLVATREVTRRTRSAYLPPRLEVLATLALSTFAVTLIMCAVVIRPEPLWTPRVALPIAGMILGNCLNAAALALDRLNAEIRNHLPRIEALVALGATRWDAARDPCRAAIRAGMTPILNALNVVGIVSLPGVMTGQILAGAAPLGAARYQIVIMLMLGLAAALTSLLAVLLGYRRYFDAEGAPAAGLRGG